MPNIQHKVHKERSRNGIRIRPDSERVTIRSVLLEFKWKLIFIFLLILVESIIALLIPLFIGLAIDHALNGSYVGVIQLGILGTLIILIGGGRRFFDSRIYARIYRRLGNETLLRIEDNLSSIKTARLGMINEIVEFMGEFPSFVDIDCYWNGRSGHHHCKSEPQHIPSRPCCYVFGFSHLFFDQKENHTFQ